MDVVFMNWDELFKIVFGVVAGVGGISGVIVAGIKFSANIIVADYQGNMSCNYLKSWSSIKLF